MITQTSSKSPKISFMKRWKEAGALERPKGMTSHSKEPWRVRKVVFHSSPSVTQTRNGRDLASTCVLHPRLEELVSLNFRGTEVQSKRWMGLWNELQYTNWGNVMD